MESRLHAPDAPGVLVRVDDRTPGRGWWRDAAVDLVTGSRCVGCERGGRLLCRDCAARVQGTARIAAIDPWPDGLGPVMAAAVHGSVAQAMVIAHKERALLALGRPLGHLLADAVAGLVRTQPDSAAPLLLVPVPARPGVVRRRGHDATAAITRHAVRRLRCEGRSAYAAPLLSARAVAHDQGDLGAQERVGNVRGSMWCPSHRLSAGSRRHPHARVVVVDDVVTTGSTLLEAQRALLAVGVDPLGSATVTTALRRSRASHEAS